MEVFTKHLDTTFRNSRNHTSCVDIAFGSPSLHPILSPRQNNLFPTASDHTIWSISLLNVSPEPDPPQFKLKTADWTKVNYILANLTATLSIPEFPNSESLDNIAEALTNTISKALEEGLVRSYSKPKQRWWTNKLSQIQADLHAATNPDESLRLQALLKEKIIEAKSRDWKVFASSCSSTSDAYLKNKLLTLDRPIRYLHPIKDAQGNLLFSAEQAVQEMLSSWFVIDLKKLLRPWPASIVTSLPSISNSIPTKAAPFQKKTSFRLSPASNHTRPLATTKYPQ